MRYFFLMIILFIPGLRESAAQQRNEVSSNIVTENLRDASDLYVSSQGIYILHTSINRLTKLNENGKQLWTVGGKGSGSYQFDRPTDVHGANGMKVYVTDRNNNRVIVFDRRGQFLSTMEAGDEFGYRQRYQPDLITVNKFGEVFFLDSNMEEIKHFDLDGNTLPGFPLPDEIKEPVTMISAGNRIHIFDRAGGGIHVLSESGNYRKFRPTGTIRLWSTDGENEVSVTDENALRFYTKETSIKDLAIPFEDEIVDVQWYNDEIYVLQKNRLYRISLD